MPAQKGSQKLNSAKNSKNKLNGIGVLDDKLYQASLNIQSDR